MSKKGTILRQCALKRVVKSTDELIRFVLSPDNELVPDIDAKAEGRGVWISLSKVAVIEAVEKNIFSRALKQRVKIGDELAQIVQKRLEDRLLGALGLARKAGQLPLGGAKVRSSIENETMIALISANDGASDGINKMQGMAKARLAQNSLVLIENLTSKQLGLALGQENVIHAALIHGAAAKSALKRAIRLNEYVTD